MTNLKPIIYSKLKEISAIEVFRTYPKTFTKLPCVSYYEINNSKESSADDDIYTENIEFIIDIWANSGSKASEITEDVIDKMIEIGFEKTFQSDVPDNTIEHITTRFLKII